MKPRNLRRELLVDMAIAAALAGFMLIVSPGLAVVGMLALLVVFVGGTGFVIEVARTRRRAQRTLQEDRWSSGAKRRAGGSPGLG